MASKKKDSQPLSREELIDIAREAAALAAAEAIAAATGQIRGAPKSASARRARGQGEPTRATPDRKPRPNRDEPRSRTWSTSRKRYDLGDRLYELNVEAIEVRQTTPNAVQVTFRDHRKHLYVWNGTSGRALRVVAGEHYQIDGTIVREEGNTTYLTRVFFVGDDDKTSVQGRVGLAR